MPLVFQISLENPKVFTHFSIMLGNLWVIFRSLWVIFKNFWKPCNCFQVLKNVSKISTFFLSYKTIMSKLQVYFSILHTKKFMLLCSYLVHHWWVVPLWIRNRFWVCVKLFGRRGHCWNETINAEHKINLFNCYMYILFCFYFVTVLWQAFLFHKDKCQLFMYWQFKITWKIH